ncbi:hypothetical protein Pmani_000207 [Petrolisthes manimaculis]|uniref:Uncharacterized protein n=1 Tax=Petrolisthes manimaculis TaxID=1843537 RepID=A0AAE1USZ1_9EUCA|nr:hypothetical protein Pmani_000207 [Petrolisthes manimaculis]
MLCEAAELHIAKEDECTQLEKNLKLREKSLTQQILAVSEKESQLEEARSMLSQQAAQVEERDQYIEELREQLASQQKYPNTAEKNREYQKMLEKAERKINDMEEENLRVKSKLLLEIAELRCRGQHQQTTPEKLNSTQLQLENDQLMQNNSHLNNQLTETKTLFDHLRRENATLENDFTALTKERDDLSENIRELSDKFISIQEERASEVLEISALRSEKDCALSQLNTIKDELFVKEADNSVENNKKLMENAFDYQEALEKQQELLNKIQELEDKVKEHEELQQKCTIQEEQFKKADEEREDIKVERDNLWKKLTETEHVKLEMEHDLIQSNQTIESLEKKVSQHMDEFKKSEIKLKEVQKYEMGKKELESHLNQEIQDKCDELRNLATVNEELKTQLSKKQQQLLEEKEQAEVRLQEVLKESDILKSDFQCFNSLQEENNLLKLKVKEHKDKAEAVESVNNEINNKCCTLEDQVQFQNRELHTLQNDYADLKEKLITFKKTSTESQYLLTEELSDAKSLTQEVENHKQLLQSQLLQKDLQINTLKDGEVHLQMELESLEEQLSELKGRVTDQSTVNQLKSDLSKTRSEESRLCQDKTELQEKLDALKVVSCNQTKHLTEKEDIIAALHGKVDSLDRKLLKAEEELEDKNHTANNMEAIKAKYGDLLQKYNILEKEVRAVKEARQEEQQQHNIQFEEQQDHIQQKEAEISSLQIEVKKLMQHSVVSCNTSNTSEMDSLLKQERELMDQDSQKLREEVRRKEALNSTLMQEILDLKSQMEKVSAASSCQSTTNRLSKTVTIDPHATPGEKQQTPVTKGRRCRKLRTLAYTPNDASQLGLDSSIEESYGKGEQFQIPSSSKESSVVPQRASRRIRNTTRSPSYEYELLKLTSRKESENDDEWQPSGSKRVPRTTRKSTRKAKPSAPPNPYLKDQENKSSLANKANDDVQLQLTEEDKPLSKKPAQRKTRQLYQTDHLEPYECTPVKLDAPEVVDSPHSVVRRQLRNKRK